MSNGLDGPTPDPTSELKVWALRAAGAVALAVVVGAPAAASWHGLVLFGQRELGLSGGWETLVPLSLDGAAFYAALLGLRAVLAGDSAVWPRLLTLVYAGSSAAFNAHAAPTPAAALFYGAMSLSAVVLWDTTLRALRRDQLRVLGVIERPAARYRPLRWVFAPTETLEAVKVAVLENVADPRQALRMVRGEQIELQGPPVPPDGGTPSEAKPEPEIVQPADVIDYEPRELTVGSKADAVRIAFATVGPDDVQAVLAWLTQRGITVDRTYVYDLRRKWTPPQPLRSVGGAQS